VTRYEHTQIGHVIIWSLLAIILIASGALIGSPFHREPAVIVSIILLVCLVLFYRLRITIEDETLCASFGPGIIRKRVGLVQIVGCAHSHSLVVWLGHSSDAVRLALQCFRLRRRSDHVARWKKICLWH
jgi:hypothetical protein